MVVNSTLLALVTGTAIAMAPPVFAQVPLATDVPGAVTPGDAPVIMVAARRSGCGAMIPRLAVAIDETLPAVKLSDADVATVKTMRASIAQLAKAKRIEEARALEEQAMNILGFEKMWLRCGEGTFSWMRRNRADDPTPIN